MPAENGKSTEMKQKSLDQMVQGENLGVKTRVECFGIVEHPFVTLFFALLALRRVQNQGVEITLLRSFLASSLEIAPLRRHEHVTVYALDVVHCSLLLGSSVGSHNFDLARTALVETLPELYDVSRYGDEYQNQKNETSTNENPLFCRHFIFLHFETTNRYELFPSRNRKRIAKYEGNVNSSRTSFFVIPSEAPPWRGKAEGSLRSPAPFRKGAESVEMTQRINKISWHKLFWSC